jgi:23S rRNA pseudoU1915 N3-methylase RlmH
MEKEWKSPKIIVGSDATGDYYYQRTNIEEEIWRELAKGNNILLSAPRRVGKTSVMKYITRKPKEGFKLIFENVQGTVTEENFYKRLYVLILSCLSRFKTNKKKIQNYLKTKGLSEVSIDSIKFEDKELDYVWEINEIIPQLDDKGETIVLLIDELPEVLHTLYKSGKNESASAILKNLRHWRQDERFKKLKFIIAGSIGIHHIVNLVEGRTSDINDIKSIHCPALDSNSEEFENYIHWALEDASISFQEGAISYLKYKIEYLVPYFINLMLDEIDKAAMRKEEALVTDKEVDKAFEKIVKNNSYFMDWKKRLKEYLKPNHFKFVNEVLINIAHKDTISIQQIYNLAVKYGETEDYMDLIYDLIQDGYIVQEEEKYMFISPFLKTYWKRNNPIFNN